MRSGRRPDRATSCAADRRKSLGQPLGLSRRRHLDRLLGVGHRDPSVSGRHRLTTPPLRVGAGHGMSPASSVRSARPRLTATITACVSIHDSQHCLPHPLAAEVGWCWTQPTLAMRRHEVADEAGALRPANNHPAEPGRGSVLARFVVAVMTPTNHRTAHPWSVASVTTTPRFMGIHGGVQHPGGRGAR